jgi:enoyl-CoA hydratase
MPKYDSFAERNLKVEIRERIATVTMNRPDKRNAIDYGLHKALEEAIAELGCDSAVGAIVLTGMGSAFSAGGDVKGFYPDDPGPMETIRTRRLAQTLVNCEAPLIAAVNGVAAGLGATVALLCDVIYMADTARIGDTHVNMGLVAGDGGAVIWPLLVGPHRAKEYLMAGKLATAEEAERMGLVNHVVPADQLMKEATAYAALVSERAAPAVRWTKMIINQALQQSMSLALPLGLATEQLSSHTDDQKEAMAAFFEKRKPKLTGK